MKKGISTIIVFALSSTFSLAFVPGPAWSATQTMPSSSCYRDSSPPRYECSFVGGTNLLAGVTGIYFDYTNNSPRNMYLELRRISFSGTVAVDARTINNVNGTRDDFVAAVNTTSVNQYDYFVGFIQHVDRILGMTLTTN